jgi:hypothetical protein
LRGIDPERVSIRLARFDVSLKPTNQEHVSTMSATAASLSASLRRADTTANPFSWGRYGRTALLTAGASVLANSVFFYLMASRTPKSPYWR